MKTAEEFCDANEWHLSAAGPIGERDAEWRRLVEEAQADARSWMERSIAIQKQEEGVEAERDRLLLELAETEEALDFQREAVQAYCDSENAMKAERDRLKGELAEAEQLVRDAMGRPEWTGWYTRAQQHFAATPAEQAQPTGRDLDICARPKCKSPRHYNIHDPERGGHVFVEPAEQATPEGALRNVMAGRLPWVTAEQAQGEAAKYVRFRQDVAGDLFMSEGIWAAFRRFEPYLLGLVNAQVAALAKRVDALDGRQDVHDTGARQIMQALERLAHRVDALGKDVATLKEIIRPAPPAPETGSAGEK